MEKDEKEHIYKTGSQNRNRSLEWQWLKDKEGKSP